MQESATEMASGHCWSCENCVKVRTGKKTTREELGLGTEEVLAKSPKRYESDGPDRNMPAFCEETVDVRQHQTAAFPCSRNCQRPDVDVGDRSPSHSELASINSPSLNGASSSPAVTINTPSSSGEESSRRTSQLSPPPSPSWPEQRLDILRSHHHLVPDQQQQVDASVGQACGS